MKAFIDRAKTCLKNDMQFALADRTELSNAASHGSNSPIASPRVKTNKEVCRKHR